MTGLYVHIPFCSVKCRFCHFAAFPGRMNDAPRYMAALSKEIQSLGGGTLETLFFGGGTPTVLDPRQWRSLIQAIRGAFTFAPGHEISVECNPESTTPEKIIAFAELGINRLSFGLQATQDRLLKGLGRLHDYATFEKVFRLARAAGFANLNVDLMYGLPGQTLADWRDTLLQVLDLAPNHISAYALTVEDRTAFGHQGVETDDDLQADMYDMLADDLEAAGYEHYEISNFARPGGECRHNLRYWRNQDCLGAGVSAAWYRDGVRRKNTENITDYISALEEGRSPVVEKETLSEPERVGEDLMLALRLKEGAELTPRAKELYGEVLHRYQALGFLTSDPKGQRWRPTRLGWRLSNRLFQELLSPPSVDDRLY